MAEIFIFESIKKEHGLKKNLKVQWESQLKEALKYAGYIASDNMPQISKNPHGKPYFVNVDNIHFNISHSGDYTAIGLSKKEIGIDIQKIVPIKPGVEAKIRQFHDMPMDFFELWSIKESYMKAEGMGFGIPLDQYWVGRQQDEWCIEAESGRKPWHVFVDSSQLKDYCIAASYLDERIKIIKWWDINGSL